MDSWSSDTAMQQRVLEELAWDPALRDADVVADVLHGVVTLRGQLRDIGQRGAVKAAVERVGGVMRVIDYTTTAFAADGGNHDLEIRESVERVLAAMTLEPAREIRVGVHSGVATLDGTLEWDFQRETIIELVGAMQGVREVVSRLQLTPRPSGGDAAAPIRRALLHGASLEADGVHVEVSGTTATLTGTVRSSAGREEAERATWSSPLITAVRNELTISPTSTGGPGSPGYAFPQGAA